MITTPMVHNYSIDNNDEFYQRKCSGMKIYWDKKAGKMRTVPHCSASCTNKNCRSCFAGKNSMILQEITTKKTISFWMTLNFIGDKIPSHDEFKEGWHKLYKSLMKRA